MNYKSLVTSYKVHFKNIGAMLSKVQMFPDMTNKGEQNIINQSMLNVKAKWQFVKIWGANKVKAVYDCDAL